MKKYVDFQQKNLMTQELEKLSKRMTSVFLSQFCIFILWWQTNLLAMSLSVESHEETSTEMSRETLFLQNEKLALLSFAVLIHQVQQSALEISQNYFLLRDEKIKLSVSLSKFSLPRYKLCCCRLFFLLLHHPFYVFEIMLPFFVSCVTFNVCISLLFQSSSSPPPSWPLLNPDIKSLFLSLFLVTRQKVHLHKTSLEIMHMYVSLSLVISPWITSFITIEFLISNDSNKHD